MGDAAALAAATTASLACIDSTPGPTPTEAIEELALLSRRSGEPPERDVMTGASPTVRASRLTAARAASPFSSRLADVGTIGSPAAARNGCCSKLLALGRSAGSRFMQFDRKSVHSRESVGGSVGMLSEVTMAHMAAMWVVASHHGGLPVGTGPAGHYEPAARTTHSRAHYTPHTCAHFDDSAADAPNVRSLPRTALGLASDHLWRHPVRCTLLSGRRVAHAVPSAGGWRGNGCGGAEVGKLHGAVFSKQHVGTLDVSMCIPEPQTSCLGECKPQPTQRAFRTEEDTTTYPWPWR